MDFSQAQVAISDFVQALSTTLFHAMHVFNSRIHLTCQHALQIAELAAQLKSICYLDEGGSTNVQMYVSQVHELYESFGRNALDLEKALMNAKDGGARAGGYLSML